MRDRSEARKEEEGGGAIATRTRRRLAAAAASEKVVEVKEEKRGRVVVDEIKVVKEKKMDELKREGRGCGGDEKGVVDGGGDENEGNLPPIPVKV